MNQPEKDPFDGAKFYTCTDPEVLNHRTPWEAIADALEQDLGDPAQTLREMLQEGEDLTVWAYTPMEVPASDATGLARHLADEIAQWFSEQDYGFEDESAEHNGFPEAILAETAVELEPIVLKALKRGNTACREVGSRSFTFEQVEALVREHRPEWLP